MSELGDAIARLESGEVWDRLGGRIHADLRAVIAEAKRADALAVVIEEARAEVGDLERSDWLRDTVAGGRLAAILSRTPSDVLVERDARIRAEVIDWLEDAEGSGAYRRIASRAREHVNVKGADRG
jgi:hypothetical protein